MIYSVDEIFPQKVEAVHPFIVVRPTVGFSPTVPQRPEGMRIEPAYTIVKKKSRNNSSYIEILNSQAENVW
jgi:hypothetical protein